MCLLEELWLVQEVQSFEMHWAELEEWDREGWVSALVSVLCFGTHRNPSPPPPTLHAAGGLF